ncbi:ATP-binding cassette domain-containing protein [Nocardia sp. CDC159]|uniref:ATP-binding cassette domain-containing protein n=1 Tax=Nocardia pulmonis TaxID=2951408 RepID=A0A9X2EDK4_9NOCA|nr:MULTISPECIES: FHA domain-containing protein [Nocardia]MCM6776146.1 ATP-binding cassette domain-containing protein [Nocardia pulmonis]MCM6788527.1 ATP-binding cassette domain-containing protein [Nocardia sp. CDC159]
MSSPTAQKITVRHEGTDRVFDVTQHVTMGRAPEVTLFVDSPLVSRVHATLAWQGTAWVLTDNGSTNGVFVEARRLTRPVPIDRPTLIRLGDAVSGPLLHLLPDGVRPNSPAPHRPAPPNRMPGQPQPHPHTPANARPQTPPPGRGAPQRPTPQPMPNFNMTAKADSSALPPMRARASTAPIARADRIPAGGLTIGRTSDNQIVVNDPLASRRHARLVKSAEGLVIEDVGSANGTFVNGRREQRTALRERDIVTIGNVDFVVADGALVHRKKPVAEQGLHVHGVGFAVEGNKQLLVDVNLAAGRGTLTALIGPSGAGKSTLSKLIAGTTHPSAGVVTFEGRNLHAEYEAMRSRIGMVPQDDVLHRQLTVRQALGFAAELRLPPDSTKADRQRVIDGVLKELSLTEHADTRVDRLSGGQRKRASVALELLTGPALLLLDEPTSGLDPALDRQVMTMLRELADAGRTVIVVTHSVACLDMCDQVLLLAPGGKTAFCGHPAAVGHFLGTSDWAEIFARVAADPDRAFANYRSRQAAAVPPPPPAAPRGVAGQPPKSSGWKQFSTLSRRQVRLILADRGYLAFLVVLPFVLGVLSLVVPGKNGFAPGPLVPLPDGSMVPSGGGETQQLLVVLILGACFMGSTLTVRDLVGERPIFHRERAVGLLPSAYLMAKVMVFGMAALLQSAVLVAIVLAGKNPPGDGTLLPSGSVELYLDLAFTAVTCVVIGLLLSTIAKSNEQVMPLLVVMIMCQLVMAGGMIPVTDRVVLEQLSYLFPSRWGFAAGASTVDLRDLFVNAQPDALWQHEPVFWLLDIAMLLVLTAILSALTWWRLRLKRSAT